LVAEFISGVQVSYDATCLLLSRSFLEKAVHQNVETLKHVTYQTIINSSRVKVTEYRGDEIVSTIFEALASKGDSKLLPTDLNILHERMPTKEGKRPVVCDFIAGMTAAYAIDFYGRLKSENTKTIFKPL
jgi:dGTPase